MEIFVDRKLSKVGKLGNIVSIAIFPNGEQTTKHCFPKVDKPGNIVS